VIELDMGEISIKINIADRMYPLRVELEEEEVIRMAAKMINDRIKDFQDNYAVRDKQDLLSMCVLFYATGLVKAERKLSEGQEDVSNKIDELERVLDNFFKA
jgi:cell division protein ZapA (FtsZ GTPase activity inhibitor)